MEIFRPATPVRIVPFQLFTGKVLPDGIRDFGPTVSRVEEAKEVPVPEAAPKAETSYAQVSAPSSPTLTPEIQEVPVEQTVPLANPLLPEGGWTRPPAVKLVGTSSETPPVNQ